MLLQLYALQRLIANREAGEVRWVGLTEEEGKTESSERFLQIHVHQNWCYEYGRAAKFRNGRRSPLVCTSRLSYMQ